MAGETEPVECQECHEMIPPDQLVRMNGQALHVKCLDATLDQALGGVFDAYDKYFGR